jgi:hypothetical protein
MECSQMNPPKKLYMPHDLVVVRNCDADEAGDYRVMPHCEVVDNPNWEIMHDMVPSDLD